MEALKKRLFSFLHNWNVFFPSSVHMTFRIFIQNQMDLFSRIAKRMHTVSTTLLLKRLFILPHSDFDQKVVFPFTILVPLDGFIFTKWSALEKSESIFSSSATEIVPKILYLLKYFLPLLSFWWQPSFKVWEWSLQNFWTENSGLTSHKMSVNKGT